MNPKNYNYNFIIIKKIHELPEKKGDPIHRNVAYALFEKKKVVSTMRKPEFTTIKIPRCTKYYPLIRQSIQQAIRTSVTS